MPRIPGELFRQSLTYTKSGNTWTLIYARVNGAGARIVVESSKDSVFVSFKIDEQDFLERITADIPPEGP